MTRLIPRVSFVSNERTHILQTIEPAVKSRFRRLSLDKSMWRYALYHIFKLCIIHCSQGAWLSQAYTIRKSHWDNFFFRIKLVPDSLRIQHIRDFNANITDQIIFSTIELVRANRHAPVEICEIPTFLEVHFVYAMPLRSSSIWLTKRLLDLIPYVIVLIVFIQLRAIQTSTRVIFNRIAGVISIACLR